MKVSYLFATAAWWLAFASAAAIKEPPAGETDISAGPKGLAKRDSVEKPRFPEPKYFRKSTSHAASRTLTDHHRQRNHRMFDEVMPWDLDADVQVTEADMYFLAAYHNMTIYYYKYGDMEKGRFFQLEVNPYFEHRDQDDTQNVIDARWIDMDTGLFIDITAARYNLDHEQGEGMLYDKHGHEYRDTYVFPLRDTTFEGVAAKIPFRYKEMLASEYGRKALMNTKFH
ncbi:mannosyltransferase [Neonectria punicea]|uniref:Mannosyltransferase n=1 Tax=Neonectria punicea TaxID=979145 RepID=A0ABR1HBK3_9HYPO